MATTKTTATKKEAAKKTSSGRKSTTQKKKQINADDIRARAEQIYLERLHKGHHGDELSDWLSAEKELRGTT